MIYMSEKICKKYGTSPIQCNWNRLAKMPRNNECDKAEFRYRISVQNYFANHGIMPKDFIEVVE